MDGCKLSINCILLLVFCVGVQGSSGDDGVGLRRFSRQADDEKAVGIETKADDETRAEDETKADDETKAGDVRATAKDDEPEEKREPVSIEKKEAIEAKTESAITKDETKDAETKSTPITEKTNGEVDDHDHHGEDQLKAETPTATQPKGKGNNPPKIVIIKARKPEPESTLILGLEWWQLLCIVFGSLIVLLFLCVCCCALLDSSAQQQQRQEVRGPNGERLGFFQAPGRHIILVMDNNMSRIRGNAARGVPEAAAAPGTGAPTATGTGLPQANPPHAPQVQPIYPKV